MSLLSRLMGKSEAAASGDRGAISAGPKPLQPMFVVGDVHGELWLLEKMLDQIDVIIGAVELSNPLLVFVGDVVDRGPDSAGVLRRMQELTREFPTNVVSLLGNHEQMMLDFLDSPTVRHARWMRNGGTETCVSFGLTVPPQIDDPEQLAKALEAAVGEELITWLRERPLMVSSGNVTCVHAAVDPARALDKQSDRVLIWGHPDFLTSTRKDGRWIAHGHTVFDQPAMCDNRISVDTGAYSSGVLSCAVILPSGEADFLTVN